MLSVGIMPRGKYFTALEIDEPRARGYQSVMLMALEDFPARQQAAEIIDRIRAEVDAREKQASYPEALAEEIGGSNAVLTTEADSSIAEKADAALIAEFTRSMENSGKGFDSYMGDAETLSRMQGTFAKLAISFPETAKGITIHLSRSQDQTEIGWFDPEDNSIHYNKALFKDWSTVEAEYERLVEEGHFPKGTDACSCFCHEFGHAIWYSRGGESLRKAVDNTLRNMGYGYVNVGQRKLLLRKLLSGYAVETTNPSYQEVIAEAISEWYTSNKPRRFCAELLKEVGIYGDF